MYVQYGATVWPYLDVTLVMLQVVDSIIKSPSPSPRPGRGSSGEAGVKSAVVFVFVSGRNVISMSNLKGKASIVT